MRRTPGTALRWRVSLRFLQETFDGADQLGVVRLDARAEALHARAAVVDEILMVVRLGSLARRLDEVGLQRVRLQGRLGGLREVDRVLVDADGRDVLVRA